MKRVTVVITDLDNTLFDWVRIWHEPFKAMLDELVRTSAIDEATLIQDMKQVFTERGTSEYAFVIQEIRSLRDKHPGENLTRKFDSAIHAFRSAQKRVLALYPAVEETLQTLKDHSVLIIGYTESQEFYTHYRLKTLGLDRIMDFIYSPADHSLPDGLTPEQVSGPANLPAWKDGGLVWNMGNRSCKRLAPTKNGWKHHAPSGGYTRLLTRNGGGRIALGLTVPMDSLGRAFQCGNPSCC